MKSARAPRRGGSRPAGAAPLAARHPATLVVAAIAALAIALSVTFFIFETDFWQHLLVGRVIWETRSVPVTQLWSWPTYGAPDINSSWGFSALLWSFYKLGGVWGLFAWRWLTTLGAFAILYAAARRMGARGLAAFVIAAICGLAYSRRSHVRPETLVSILLAIEIWILETRRNGGPDRSPWLVAVAWAWANAHISYHIGFVILGIYWLNEVVASRRSPGAGVAGLRPRKLVLVGLAALAISFVNPFGWHALWQPFDFLITQRSEPIFQTIGELQPLRLNEYLRYGVPLILVGWPLLIAWRWVKSGPDWAELLLAGLTLTLALTTMRFVGLLALVAFPFMARDLDAWIGSRRWPAWTARPLSRAGLATAAVLAVGLPGWTAMHLGVGIEWRYFPVKACDFIRDHGIRGRAYNTFSLGGYMLYRFWPDRGRLPFMDIHQAGTVETRRLYTFSRERRQYWEELQRQFSFDYALLGRLSFAADRLPDFLDADTSWTLVFIDDAASLFVRRDGPLREVAEAYGYELTPAGNVLLKPLGDEAVRSPEIRARFAAELERQVRESPFNSSAHRLLASLSLLDGNLEEARDHLRRALEVEPRDPVLRRMLDNLERRGGR